jgi:hypothetical protein
MMGHSSVLVTERHAHLRPDLFTDRDFGHMDVDLSAGDRLVSLVYSGDSGEKKSGVGYAVATRVPSR